MLESFIFRLIVLMFLIGYLIYNVVKRFRAESVRRMEAERYIPCDVIDTSLITTKLEELRQDYTARIRGRVGEKQRSKGLLANAQRMIATFSYFRTRHGDSDLQQSGV